MALSDDFLMELRNRADIENTISSYVNLKRAGRISKGLCPFHGEKTASFTVYPDTQSYYCFGCGSGGDVITFIKNIIDNSLFCVIIRQHKEFFCEKPRG